MLVPLKAKRSFPYAGRALKAGQEFDAETKSDAHLLVTIGHAERRVSPLPVYPTREMRAVPVRTRRSRRKA